MSSSVWACEDKCLTRKRARPIEESGAKRNWQVRSGRAEAGMGVGAGGVAATETPRPVNSGSALSILKNAALLIWG